jgi:ATP-dependent DNA helicase PIF1
MQLCSAALALRPPINALRSPQSFVSAIMLQRAVHREASASSRDNKQSPLQFNASAVNVVPARNSSNGTKRKFDRSLSTTSNLGSLHHQQSFDENSVGAFVDLTDSPDAKSRYPAIGPVDPVNYPTLPPNPRRTPPPLSSSAPEVPWSTSPAEHLEAPEPMNRSHEMRSPDPVSPVRKKRTLPSTFAKAGPTREQRDDRGEEERAPWRFKKDNNTMPVAATNGVRQFPNGGREKASRAMSDMLEHSKFVRQKSNGSLSRTTTVGSNETVKPSIEKETSGPEKVPELFLSDEQKGVMKAVVEEGKSVFFTGSAGTGKSVLMRAIISQLKHKYRKEPERFAVTASTGLASCILEGQTLHSWAGIGLGKEPAPELVKRIRKNQKSRRKWLTTKVLIIDEVSMVDGQLFDKLEQVARTIRNNGRPFGGIQLVVTGDFFQLPPVPEKNTVAKFVFEAVTWDTCIQHTILLTHVFRQKDESFARMLNEMRLGKMTSNTVREFQKLSRPLNFRDELEATEL